MFDINTVLSAALSAAITEATKPLLERIATLESANDILHKTQHEDMVAMRDRISRLENNPAQGVDTQAAPTTDITRHIIDALGDTDHPLFKRLSSFMDAVAEQAMDDHCSTYDHDDYDNHIGDDDKHFDGDIDDAVRDAVSNLSFEVSVS